MTVSWMGYDFNVYSPDVYWNDVPGVYIFTGRNAEGLWVPVYIGQTNSFKNRLPSHERWLSARGHGATHVHARVEYNEATRQSIETELIRGFQPLMNRHGLFDH